MGSKDQEPNIKRKYKEMQVIFMIRILVALFQLHWWWITFFSQKYFHH